MYVCTWYIVPPRTFKPSQAASQANQIQCNMSDITYISENMNFVRPFRVEMEYRVLRKIRTPFDIP